jgi:hypothetical protein
MNPVDSNDQPSINLPNPGNPMPQATPYNAPVPHTDKPINPHPIAPLPSVNSGNSPMAQSVSPINDLNPQVAEDSDLIEQEWVDKAKAIVDHTRADPYRQNIEINKMKADYIKKRYGKDIKAPSE